MSLYLGNTKINAIAFDNYAWWGGKNPEFLYETTYNCKLSDTNWADKTPSSSQQNILWPATTYTTSGTALAYPTFDRWGVGYHDGEYIDTQKFNYFVLEDCILDIKYSVDEATMGSPHLIKSTQTNECYIYATPRCVNGIIIPSSSQDTFPYGNTYNMTHYGLWYRNASNVLNYGKTSYGFYFGTVGPALSANTSKAACLNLRLPYLYFRSNNTYQVLATFNSVNASTTDIKIRQRLYKIEKPSIIENPNDRIIYMFNNNTFPIEVI